MNPETVLFHRGETVYHKTDEDPGIVTGIIFREAVSYEVVWPGRVVEEHQAIELSKERVYYGAAKKDEDKA